MKKIKVAQVITRLDWGGSPDIVRVICTYLDPEVYDITLIIGVTKYPNLKTEEFLKKFGQKALFLPELKRNINPLSDLAAFLRLYFLFRRQKFDIVHTHTAKAGALARTAAFLAGTPVIVHTLHGHNFYGYFGPVSSRIVTIIERWLGYLTDKIIALTELERKDLISFKAAGSEKIRLIYQGLEMEGYAGLNIDKHRVRHSLGIKPDEKVVGMIGRLEPVKGPEYFIKAAKSVAEVFPRVKFILVGEGSLREKLEKQMKSLGLEEKFIFTGWREDIPEILSILDLLVLPSLNEGVGMVLIEAQGLGVPIVASRVGGIPEIVRDNQTGILVSAGDADSFAGAIKSLLADENRRSAMSQEAIKWIKGKFKARDMIEEISKLYQELLALKKKL